MIDIAEPKIPASEYAWAGYRNKRGDLMFVITSKNGNREQYFLYELQENKFVKLGKGKSPTELCEKYNVIERISK